MTQANSVSVVVPIYNEIENIPLLYRRLCDALGSCGRPFELVWVDDGSTDGSQEQLRQLAELDSRVALVILKRNFGQTAAMKAGIDAAEMNYIVTIDGDLQNEPDDIPAMLDKLDEGYDLVHGWRRDRQDAVLHRKLPSRIANWLISKVAKFPVHDLGCTLKAMRNEVAKELELYGEMHRFIPILAHARGARCVEMVTRHHARQFGQTKYGIDRTPRVLLDLLTVKYLVSYFASPMQFFGRFGLACVLLSLVTLVATVVMKLASGVDMTGNPLLLLSCGSMFAALQFFCMGILGEVAARNYFVSGQRKSYSIRETVRRPPIGVYRDTA